MTFKKTYLYITILLITPFLAFTAFASTVTGKVSDAKTNEAIAGATVTITQLRLSTITDANGSYTFRSLPAKGKFLVEVRSLGYKTMIRAIDIADPKTYNFALATSVMEAREVVITGTPIAGNSKTNSTSATTVNREDLLTPANNLIDALAKQVPGVSQITTGPAISKPVIRGLSYNRVVTLSDGIKQQGQQWGDEHGIEIDQYQGDRVEVLRGASSLLYGSDAIGGVINILEPLSPPPGQIRGEVLSNYSTNNGLSGSSVMLTGNDSGFVWRTRASYQNAYSFKTPTGYFPNSGFNQTNLSGMLGLNKGWGYSHLNLSYFKNNIGFYDPQFDSQGNYVNDEGEQFTDKDYKSRTLQFPRQDIRHYKAALNNSFAIGTGSLKVDLGYQKNQRRELDNPTPALFFDLNTYSLDAKYYLPESNGWEPVIGVSGDLNHSVNKGSEFLVPAYNTYSTGAFAFAKKSWDKNTFNAGLRYDYIYNKGNQLYIDNEQKFAGFENKFSNISYAAGFTHIFNDNLNFKANAGSAFRAPNPAELGSNGVHEGSYRYEIGNPDLKPERSYQADATLEFDSKVVSGSFGVYENYIRNYIYASSRTGDNITVTDDNGNPTMYAVYHYGQVNANLMGLEGSLTIHPAKFLHFENTFGYTHAQNTTFDRPLAFIPAATVHNTLRFEPSIRNLQSSFIYVGLDNAFAQNRVDATFETPTSSYTLINAGIGTTVKLGKQPVKLYVSGNNLANKKYYDALSRFKPGRLDQTNPTLGVYNPGRNITFGFYMPLALKN
ncbi:TonB-dependent receptor [Mucilaginibacter sp. RS28]|uniref:TonB-dependent receptor n=1 Tax=Mucilaginibacter straminoryzae TaxID=2932774 RepID=A0A9X1WZY3_9SPHI|nr:TonB-dependent receptor [Mucilaginibacter straminoryzae]MCJ8208722.1 TonB-dependent receptor [Mucilaginibacter straminoryzae]